LKNFLIYKGRVMEKKTVFFIVVAAVLIAGAIYISCQKDSGITTPSEVPTLVLNAPGGPHPSVENKDITWDEPVCVGEPITFTLSWTGGDGIEEVQVQRLVGTDWIQIFQESQANSPQDYLYTFDVVGTENLRYKIGSGGFSNPVEVEVEQCGECETWQCETAYGGDSYNPTDTPPYRQMPWWYWFDPSEGSTQTVWAGQTIDVGDVELVNVEGTLHIVITLADDWELVTEKMTDDCIVELDEEDNPIPYSEPVKIQGYNEGDLPGERLPAGQYTTYKGTASDVTVPSYDYYVIHLDVRKCLD
jgi:hypothetical protein